MKSSGLIAVNYGNCRLVAGGEAGPALLLDGTHPFRRIYNFFSTFYTFVNNFIDFWHTILDSRDTCLCILNFSKDSRHFYLIIILHRLLLKALVGMFYILIALVAASPRTAVNLQVDATLELQVVALIVKGESWKIILVAHWKRFFINRIAEN